MASLTTRQAADKLDDAYQAFARDNGDGFSSPDWQGAYDHREDGYALAEQAFELHSDDRADFIEAGVECFEESSRYLIARAADYRLAELIERQTVKAAA